MLSPSASSRWRTFQGSLEFDPLPIQVAGSLAADPNLCLALVLLPVSMEA